MKDRIVLAYDGPAAATTIARLRRTHRAEVVTVTLDLGQRQDLEQVRAAALAEGALRAHVLDVREELARDYVLTALQAGALYAGRYPMTASLARPLIAAKLVEVARIESAAAVAHGAAGRGNDLLPLDLSLRALDPAIRILTPAREGAPAPPDAAAPRVDENLWGRSVEAPVLDDAWQEPPDSLFQLTRATSNTPDAPAYVEVSFDRGVPVSINRVNMAFTEVIDSLTTIAGSHGVGRMDTIEKRQGGIVSREVCEAPAAVVLHAAHRELETLVLPRDLDRLKRELSLKYAELVYNGLWFTPMREALDAFTARVQQAVTGTIRLKLFKGSCEVVGRSPALQPPDAAVVSHASASLRVPTA